MRISLAPQRSDGALAATKAGDVLILNGDPIDLSVIPDGATLPAGAIDSQWIVGAVHRIGGALHLTLLLPHGPNPSEAVAFPADLVDPPDGPLAIPADPEPEPEPVPEPEPEPEPEGE